MVKFLRLLFVIVIMSSCSKKYDSTNSASSVKLPDTLSAGWTTNNSLPNENFRDIFFTDNSSGYAVSNNGIYKSGNGGTDWTKINPATTITNIGAGNSSNAAFTDNAYNVLVTQDGGASFTNGAYTYPGGGEVGFFDCFFSSANTCYFSSNQYLWKSVNAGVSIDTIFHFSNISPTSSLFFLNDLEGWILRQDGIYQTIDGGVTWNVDTAFANGYGSIQFLDSNNGYFSNYGTINKTTDGGITWLPVFQGPFNIFTDIDFINVNDGYLSTGRQIYKTSDAGATWNVVVSLGNASVGEIYFTDANHGWACTSDGTIVKYAQ